MRKVERPDCPDFLRSYLANEGLGSHRDWGRGPSFAELREGLFKKFQRIRREAFTELWKVFKGKCAYCETSGAHEIDQFRPKSIDVYAHLLADWRNLFPACAVCNRSKGARFEVRNGVERLWTSYDDIVERESPSLLDPCKDDPADHLIYLSDGQVAGLTRRGAYTVTTLALNRLALVHERARLFESARRAGEPERRRLTDDEAPFAGAIRQFLAASALKDAEARRQALHDQARFDAEHVSVNTERGHHLDNYKSIARYVEHLEIKNFGPIRDLSLDLSAPRSSGGPCFAILGENGVGKSTVLRALALALAGPTYAKRLKLVTSRSLLSEDARKGHVRVRISGQPPVEMKLALGKPIAFSMQGSTSLVLAYGATRLLPRGRHKPKKGMSHAKIDNLFDPFLPMTDPTAWLKALGSNRLPEVNRVLERLLPKDHQIQVVADDVGHVRIEVAGEAGIGLGQLSDGYQSMVGMAVDIMHVMHPLYDAMEEAQGVVLIDELGNHFHPAWRLRCVEALRSAFPKLQFIFSTHDPLCLRGMKEREVAVLRRDKRRRIYALEDLPRVDRLRVDQLLTSEHFGLRSTLDPELEDQVMRYEQLLAQSERSEQEERQLSDLIQELTDEKYLGATRRERLALQLVDFEGEWEIPRTASVNAQAMSAATAAKLKRLMRGIAPAAGGGHDQG